MIRYTIQASSYSNNMEQLKAKLKEASDKLDLIKGKLVAVDGDYISKYVQQITDEINSQILALSDKCSQSATQIMSKANMLETEEARRLAEEAKKRKEEAEKLNNNTPTNMNQSNRTGALFEKNMIK